MAVVLDPDVVLHREGHRRPGVRLELGRVDEIICTRYRLRHEHVVAQALLVGVPNLHLRDLFEEVALHSFEPLQHHVEAGPLEGRARGDGDSAALADRELRHHALVHVLQRQEEPLGELGPRERVREEGARCDEVRLHQRAARRDEFELAQAFPEDRPDARCFVRVACANDDSRGGGVGIHGWLLSVAGRRVARALRLSTNVARSKRGGWKEDGRQDAKDARERGRKDLRVASWRCSLLWSSSWPCCRPAVPRRPRGAGGDLRSRVRHSGRPLQPRGVRARVQPRPGSTRRARRGHVVACIAGAQVCDDRAWAGCAALVGPHADGGPPAPPSGGALEIEDGD